MSTTIQDGVRYTCPRCGSADVQASMWAWEDANAPHDIEIDWESDVGCSEKWHCRDCDRGDFLPHENNKGGAVGGEWRRCGTCGKSIKQYGAEWFHADGVIYRHVARPVSGSAEGQRAGE